MSTRSISEGDAAIPSSRICAALLTIAALAPEIAKEIGEARPTVAGAEAYILYLLPDGAKK